jgi:hypothetical protein
MHDLTHHSQELLMRKSNIHLDLRNVPAKAEVGDDPADQNDHQLAQEQQEVAHASIQ